MKKKKKHSHKKKHAPHLVLLPPVEPKRHFFSRKKRTEEIAALTFPELEKKKLLENAPSPPRLPKLHVKLGPAPKPHAKPVKLSPVPTPSTKKPSKPPVGEIRFPELEEAQKKAVPEAETIRPSPESFDPWQKTLELMLKCQRSVDRGRVDLGEISYAALQPFYSRLSLQQRAHVYPYLVDLREELIRLRLNRIRKNLKKHR